MKTIFIALSLLLQTHIFATYHSQCGQDKFISETYFKGDCKGVFVDIGAHDGMTYSNTYFFEKDRGWTGICVEPIPEVFAELQKNRNCICVQACVTNRSGDGQLLKVSHPKDAAPDCHIEMLSGLQDKYDPRHLDRIQREIADCKGASELIPVQCYQLNELLEKNNIAHVNFLSIDTEGNEFDILTGIDFERYKIDVIAVEDNYGDSRFTSLLSEKGYNFVTKLTSDLIFVHKDFQPQS